jgi:hypothetical protein
MRVGEPPLLKRPWPSVVRHSAPFDDGNGRIARAIGDLLLARADGSPQRFYSLSAQIQRERKAYYDILERTQKRRWTSPSGLRGSSTRFIAPSTRPSTRWMPC